VTPTQTGHTFISLKHTNLINELSVHNLPPVTNRHWLVSVPSFSWHFLRRPI
jgi:hypothetical protein